MENFIVGFFGMLVILLGLGTAVGTIGASFHYLGPLVGVGVGVFWFCVLSGLREWANN
ncbi:hypothetical protein [Rhizobium phage RHEph21]|uniref:Transmembrane protein n=1 Tax=Rhizobium phage RHEph21 TaxID=2836134 RepID=A0AAE7VMU8_9CAUD|nr:hypothetical protein [Rhizobium phage RHEph21]